MSQGYFDKADTARQRRQQSVSRIVDDADTNGRNVKLLVAMPRQLKLHMQHEPNQIDTEWHRKPFTGVKTIPMIFVDLVDSDEGSMRWCFGALYLRTHRLFLAPHLEIDIY